MCQPKINNIHLASVVFILFNISMEALADGSKDLYPAGAPGGRAYMASKTNNYTSGTGLTSFPFITQGTHYVYAEEGQTIYAGSSAQGQNNNGEIRIFSPSGHMVNSGSNQSTIGKIVNRTEELAGPRTAVNPTGYHPFTVTVGPGQAGVWRVEFVGPAGANSNSVSGPALVAADEEWTDHSQLIAAWDVSVSEDGANMIPGRVFTNVLNLYLVSNFNTILPSGSYYSFYGILYTLTNDGYVYRVQGNGSHGAAFTFFVNNKGFYQESIATNPARIPSYQSRNSVSDLGNWVQDPRLPDTDSDVTQKIFYTLPDQDMPPSSSGALPGGSTWLYSRTLPQVTGLEIVGLDGTVGRVSTKGAQITFNSNLVGRYIIEVYSPVAPGSPGYFPTRTLEGNAVVGDNSVNWDGLDGDGNRLPPGDVERLLAIRMQGAEVHFPYIDMEINPNGIIIELLSDDYSSVVSDYVFWDDSSITGGHPNEISIPQSITEMPGSPSSTAGHKWGTYTATSGSGNNGTGNNSFGNVKSMDTWTYILGNRESQEVTISVVEADLEVVGITPYTTIPSSPVDDVTIGTNLNYQVMVHNNGPNDILTNTDPDNGPVENGAPFSFTAPEGFDIHTDQITFTSDCGATGTITESPFDPTSNTYNAIVDLPAGCTITFTIPGTVTETMAGGDTEMWATIMRPNDVTDPDATNTTSDYPLIDPYFECQEYDPTSGDPIPCNNIKKSTVFNHVPALTFMKEGVYNTDTDEITYTFTVTNTGNVTLSDIAITDLKIGMPPPGSWTHHWPNAVGVLQPTEQYTATTTYTPTQAEIDAGEAENQAIVNASTPPISANLPPDILSDDPNNPADPGNPGNPTVAPIPQQPALSISKTAEFTTDNNSDGNPDVGDIITYTFTVINTGNVTLTNVEISDPRTGVGNWNHTWPDAGNTSATGTLTPGETYTATATYAVTQNDVDNGRAQNLATATGTPPSTSSNPDPDPIAPVPSSPDPNNPNTPPGTETEVPITQTPELSLTKVAALTLDNNSNGNPDAGDVITYTFTVINTGNVTLTNVEISEPMAGVGNWNHTWPNAENTSASGILAPGESYIATATYTVTQDNVDNGRVENLATATGTPPSTSSNPDPDPIAPVPSSPDPNNPNTPPGTETEVPITQTPELSLTKVAALTMDNNSNGNPDAGDVITYTFTVTNTGNVTLANVEISEPMAELGSWSHTWPDQENTSTSGILAPGESYIATATYTVVQVDVDSRRVENQATTTGTPPSPDPNDPQGPITPVLSDDPNTPEPDDPTVVNIIHIPELSFTKAAVLTLDADNNGIVYAGDVITYTFIVTNTGNVALTNVAITEPMAGLGNWNHIWPDNGNTSTTGMLAPGENYIATATYTLTQEDVDNGRVENQATTTGTPPSPDPNDPQGPIAPVLSDDPNTPEPVDPTVVNIPHDPSLSFTKAIELTLDADNNGMASVGDVLTYTFIVTNTGNINLSNITITDTDLPGLSALEYTWPSATPGQLGLGQTMTATAVYTVIPADITAERVQNQATTTGTSPSGTPFASVLSDDPSTDIPDDPTSIPTGNIIEANEDRYNVTNRRGESVTTASVLDNDEFNRTPANLTNITLTPGNSSSPSLVMNPDGTITVATHTLPGVYEYPYTICDALSSNSCSTSIAYIEVEASGLFIPNVFTPNKDGINDTFEIVGGEGYDRVELIILNRWGNEVYRNNNYRNEWDAAGLSEGTYFYIVRMSKNNTDTVHKGHVLIKQY